MGPISNLEHFNPLNKVCNQQKLVTAISLASNTLKLVVVCRFSEKLKKHINHLMTMQNAEFLSLLHQMLPVCNNAAVVCKLRVIYPLWQDIMTTKQNGFS